MREWGCAWGHRFPLACAVLRPLVMILFPLLPLRRQRTMMAGQKTAEEAQEQAAREFIERFNASADKALDSVDANKVNHIMENAEHPWGHNWETILGGQKPTWEQLKPVLKEVMRQEGSEVAMGKGSNVYIRCMEYNEREIFVKYLKDDAGLVTRISTVYMSFQNAGDV